MTKLPVHSYLATCYIEGNINVCVSPYGKKTHRIGCCRFPGTDILEGVIPPEDDDSQVIWTSYPGVHHVSRKMEGRGNPLEELKSQSLWYYIPIHAA